MYLSTLGIAIAVLACRDLLAPLEQLRPPAASPYLNAAGRIVVYPDSLHGWSFYNDQQDVACADSSVCRFVSGPGTVPLGSGSAELAVSATSEGKALVLADYKGVRLDQLTTLSYSTYRQTTNSGNNLAISLQLNVDFDLSDNATGYQGRLVYEPYLTASGQVVDSSWQNWNTKAGKWWGTKNTVSKGGVTVSNPCVQSAPCTWSQLLAAFPNVGIHSTYGAVVLKAGSGWANFRGNVDSLAIGIDGSTTTFDFEATAPVSGVPIAAPDSVPKAVWDSLTAESNVLVNPPGLWGHIIRDAVLLAFKPTAAQAERQAAVSLVGGRVVGGLAIGSPEHVYVVRIPYSLASGDSISGPVLRAAVALRSLASVQLAVPIPMDPLKSYYRRPSDGSAFRAWPISRDSLIGANWAQIGVNGPLAWGCATGSQLGESPPNIAIVDNRFHDVADMRGNLGSVREFAPSDTNQHGLMVAAIAGAVGGNDSGMTGMMWHARINLFNNLRRSGADTTFSVPNAAVAVTRAIQSGARVINISWGINPEIFSSGHPRTRQELDYLAMVTEIFGLVVDGSRDPVTGKYKTLFVVAAGNNQSPAFEAGWPTLARDSAHQSAVIAVASTYRASRSTQRLDVTSNSGPLVEIAAPGDQVASLDSTSSVVTVSGTSFAAPLVTGAAGLLFAFDPALTPDTVKKLLIDGANLSPRSVDDLFDVGNPKPVLDVYASLQLAARRTAAPLCGNKVYSDGSGNVFKDRGPTNQPEKLFTSVDAPYADLLNALHGGRRVQIGDYLEYKWSSLTRTWSRSTLDGNYHQDAGGAFLSWYDGSDHDATMYHVTNGSAADGFRSQFATLPAQLPLGFTSTVVAPARNVVGSYACSHGTKDSLVTYSDCPDSAVTFIGSAENPLAVSALAPQGDFVLIGINYRMQSQSYGPVYGSTGNLVLTTANMRDTSASFELWRVDTVSLRDKSRLPRPVKVSFASPFNEYSRDQLEIAWLAIDETGTEIVWELRKRFSDFTAGVFRCTNRVVEYRALAGHSPTTVGGVAPEEGALLGTIPLPDLNRRCPSSFGPATFSPFRGTTASAGGSSAAATIR